MSKDFTPSEQVYCDYLYSKKDVNVRDLTWKVKKGDEWVVLPPDKNKERFPEMTFLCSGIVSQLCDLYLNDEKALCVLDEFECIIKEIEQAFLKKTEQLKDIFKIEEEVKREFIPDIAVFESRLEQLEIESMENIKDIDPKAVTCEWFFGGMDSNFYYNDVNNERFRNYVNAYVGKALKEKTMKKEREHEL